MSEMVERLARVLCRQRQIRTFGVEVWNAGELDAKVDDCWRSDVITARAVIEDMREPTERMVEIIACNHDLPSAEVSGIYKAMIDEALK